MDVSGQLHTPAALRAGKSPQYPHWTGVLGGSQSRSERGDEEKKIPAPTGNRIPVVQPVAWSLYRLSYAGSLMSVT
jgi:hypothetical protein